MSLSGTGDNTLSSTVEGVEAEGEEADETEGICEGMSGCFLILHHIYDRIDTFFILTVVLSCNYSGMPELVCQTIPVYPHVVALVRLKFSNLKKTSPTNGLCWHGRPKPKMQAPTSQTLHTESFPRWPITQPRSTLGYVHISY